MAQEYISIRGARQHNLKNIDIDIPRNKLVIITGLSGSGKSSLAFDTIYAEGQRRYVESLSAYARQFLGQMDKPDVDHIDGLSPAISIDQKTGSRSPRSTVGTVTEIYDYLRLLYARVGIPHCPQCGREINRQTVQEIVDTIQQMDEGSRIMLLAPLVRDRKGEHRRIIEDLRKAGYVRARINGELYDLDEQITLDRYKMHTIEAVIDRLVVRRYAEDEAERCDADRRRLSDSVETALRLGDGVVIVTVVGGQERMFSEKYACPTCGISLPEIEPRSFSFNSPHGACPACAGLGYKQQFDPRLIVPDDELSLGEGAIEPWEKASKGDNYFRHLLEAVAHKFDFDMDTPWKDLSQKHRDIILNGSAGESVKVHYTNNQGKTRTYDTVYEGVIPNLERRYAETSSDYMRQDIEQYMAMVDCPECHGRRLKPESLAVTVAGLSIDQVAHLSIDHAGAFVRELAQQLTEREMVICRQILKELLARLRFLEDVGLHYLTLDRGAATLSGGEAQRIRLATQIGSQLMGVLYILDEPSIGLHQRDNQRLIDTLVRLRDLGNTVLVVEHDEATIRAADYVVDLGPGAGENGGEIVFHGTLPELLACEHSLTGQYLSGAKEVPVPARRLRGNGKALTVVGASGHNLKNVTARIPLGCFVAITGVSGSGKSTLLMETVYRRLAQELYKASDRPEPHEALRGIQYVDKVIDIDQSPIGRTPRSNPATYAGIFGQIRSLFASVPEAKMRGYKAGRFSFNVKGGRCEACQGAGIVKIEMQFLPDVYVPCEVCGGKRYNREALEITYKGLSIADVLDMTVDEALRFFQNIPAIRSKLETLHDVGLGYIRLGQPATTLSGGEAQRVKLAKELSRRATGKTFYILDEPTVGLHADDVRRLMMVLKRLVENGNTVAVIEHNLDVIKSADWVIDLGPEGGDAGGQIIAEGTPEEVAANERSYTGQFLRAVLPGWEAAGGSAQMVAADASGE
ncbi:MAG: excinuclease ABC subunit UvrA [Chloroflexi bacterium]|nr:excinuclease ABC subunit UvrA [Chloroflexota bacterium]